MAEIGIVASVISIVGFALDLSKKLYDFSATTSAAGEEVDYIAKNVTNFADALQILAERLDEDENPIYSKHTVKVVYRLYDEACDLFERIEDLIPEPKNSRDDLSFLQKVTWNFKKGRVEFLAGQIEYLKSTVSLVATVLFAGRKVRSRRRSRRQKHNVGPLEDSVDQARQRINIAVVEHVQATDNLPNLQEKAEHDDQQAIQAGEFTAMEAGPRQSTEQSLIRTENVTPVLKLRLNSEATTLDNKQIALRGTDNTFFSLLKTFTTLDVSLEEQEIDVIHNTSAHLNATSEDGTGGSQAGQETPITQTPTLKADESIYKGRSPWHNSDLPRPQPRTFYPSELNDSAQDHVVDNASPKRAINPLSSDRRNNQKSDIEENFSGTESTRATVEAYATAEAKPKPEKKKPSGRTHVGADKTRPQERDPKSRASGRRWTIVNGTTRSAGRAMLHTGPEVQPSRSKKQSYPSISANSSDSEQNRRHKAENVPQPKVYIMRRPYPTFEDVRVERKVDSTNDYDDGNWEARHRDSSADVEPPLLQRTGSSDPDEKWEAIHRRGAAYIKSARLRRRKLHGGQEEENRSR